ncbi:hypothetical protein C8T65DRAFT_741820 [Cerioporus squamosus]|nr:hypothetical protein C8T65DRAFT_741820 [Cerioporus squamosus]
MDTCPNEVLGLIFTLACVDDGYTGRTLSLVSKHVRDTSRRYTFQSIALYGSCQLSAFAALLERVEPQHRRVRNLYLADRRRVWMEYKPGQDRASWLRERLTEDFHVTDPAREYSSDAILRILRCIAPTLRTLAIFLFDRYDEMALTMPFPALQELTIYGSLLNHHGNAEIPQCGALRRLHIVQDFSLRKSVPRAVSRVAPSLTHLRISRLVSSGLGSGDIVHGLERMLEQPGQDDAVFPSSLEHIFIQMSQQEVLDHSGKSQLLTSPVAHQLKDLAMRDASRRVTLLKPHLWNPADSFSGRDTDVEYYMGIKAEWERRNAGLGGLWDVKQSDVLASYRYCAEETRS